VKDLMRLLRQPLEAISPDFAKQLITTGIVDSFVITLELAFFGGIVVSLPFLIYFLASFVLPALTRQEKRFLFPGILVSTLLFLGGVLTSYYWLLPHTLRFFHDYAANIGVQTLWSWRDYLSFCSWLTIGFGLLCQLPVVVIALASFGLVNYPLLARTRAYAITGILILAAIIAPTPDPLTFISLGAPIVALYEACIWIVWLIDRRKARTATVREL
jgi:sec-independent protein translocase protein TatC